MISCADVRKDSREGGVIEGKIRVLQTLVKLAEHADVKDSISSVYAPHSEKANFVIWSVVMFVMGTRV
jgi:hypothetical protein